ncbi:MAG TPA: hypothetical protein VGM84_02695 [Steroidobacteraceae bacterium]
MLAIVVALVALAVTMPNIGPEPGTAGTEPSHKAVLFYLTLAVVPVILIFIGGQRLRLNVLGWIVLSVFFLSILLK